MENKRILKKEKKKKKIAERSSRWSSTPGGYKDFDVVTLNVADYLKSISEQKERENRRKSRIKPSEKSEKSF